MKTIDWKEVSSNSKLMNATETVAKEMLPSKSRGKGSKIRDLPSIKSARENLKHLSLAYHQRPSRAKKKALEVAKKELDEAYLKAEADFIDGKINEISSLHIGQKHHAAWKTIGELSGKRSKPTTRIKGGSSAKRKSSWHNHFKDLLGKSPKTPENSTLPMEKISNTLDICIFEFTIDKLKIVIKSLKKGYFTSSYSIENL